MRKQIRVWSLVLVLCALFSLRAACGDGDGSGGGRDQPLVLVQSSISNGAEDVAPNVRIVLRFNKNVVNIIVRENNQKCFSVTDSAGNAVPITVEMGDDQVDPSDETKRTVTIVPQSPYRAGETYLLKISSELAAKNGRDKLDKDLYISFTIRSDAASPASATKATKPACTTTTTTAYSYAAPAAASPAAETSTATVHTTAVTTTTTRPATTKKASAPLPAASRQAVTLATSAASRNAQTAASGTQTSSVAQSSAPTTETPAATAAVTTAVTTTMQTTETESAAAPLTETAEPESAWTEPETTAAETTGETTAADPQTEPETSAQRAKPAILIGIMLLPVTAAAAAVGVIHSKKKKGS